MERKRPDRYISIHALREEGDGSGAMRGGIRLYFYPRPPRGGRPRPQKRPRQSTLISIHALREEGDGFVNSLFMMTILFLSTPSARRATSRSCARRGAPYISIHALREEGDSPSPTADFSSSNFYPRPPRGGRPQPDFIADFYFIFLSTPSARRAT